MLNGVSQIFDNMSQMMKKLKKKSYERNFAEFQSLAGQYLLEMTTYMTKASDKEAMAKELAVASADDLDANYEGPKKKIKGALAHLPSYKQISEVTIRAEEFEKTTSRKIKRAKYNG